jgi:hypothetical protein
MSPRTDWRDVLAEIQVVTTPQEDRVETQKAAIEGAFLRAAGGQQTLVVAEPA